MARQFPQVREFNGIDAVKNNLPSTMRKSKADSASSLFYWHLYERPLRAADWTLVGTYRTEREADDAMLNIPARACDYSVKRKPRGAETTVRKAA